MAGTLTLGAMVILAKGLATKAGIPSFSSTRSISPGSAAVPPANTFPAQWDPKLGIHVT